MKSLKPTIVIASITSLLLVGTGTAVARVDVGAILREHVELVTQPMQEALLESLPVSEPVEVEGVFEKEPASMVKIVDGVPVFVPEEPKEGPKDESSEDHLDSNEEAVASGERDDTWDSAASKDSGSQSAEDSSDQADSESSSDAQSEPQSDPVAQDGLPRIAGPGKGGNDIRIHISGFAGTPEISGTGSFAAYSGPFQVGTFSAGERVSVRIEGSEYVVNVRGNDVRVSDPVRFVPSGGVMQIANYANRPTWNPSYNDNLYRGKLEVVNWGGRPIVVNEINLEDYMKGLAEMTNSSPVEKIRAITIAARSYAKFYMINGGKFAGPYDLDDSPARSQKYLGYGYEQRAGNVTVAVNSTRGMVLGYNGVIIKAPYFSQSDGVATRNALDVWGWSHTPYLVSVDDSACTTSNGSFAGHGVGMSGCGSHGMAMGGSSYRQILEHYYTGVQILDLY